MKIKYSIMWPVETGNTGIYDKSGSIKLTLKGMSKEEVERVATAINNSLTK